MAKFAPGLYQVRITKQGFDESKEKKTPFFWLGFIPEGVFGQAEDGSEALYQCDDYPRSITFYLTDKTVDRTRDNLMSLGWDGNRFQDLEPGGAHSFDGVITKLECRHEQNSDKVYEKWEFPGPGATPKENKPGLARNLDALFGKAKKPPVIKPAGKPPAARPAPASKMPDYAAAEKAASGNTSGEDIPF